MGCGHLIGEDGLWSLVISCSCLACPLLSFRRPLVLRSKGPSMPLAHSHSFFSACQNNSCSSFVPMPSLIIAYCTVHAINSPQNAAVMTPAVGLVTGNLLLRRSRHRKDLSDVSDGFGSALSDQQSRRWTNEFRVEEKAQHD